jgi:hypothetical protein
MGMIAVAPAASCERYGNRHISCFHRRIPPFLSGDLSRVPAYIVEQALA